MKTLMPLLLLLAACGVGADPNTTTTPEPQTQLQPEQPAQQQQTELTGFPCDVRAVLQSACASCHAPAVYFRSFTTRDELVPLSTSAHERLSSATQPMPPYGAARQLSEVEKQTLLTWFAAGAPAGGCGPLTAP